MGQSIRPSITVYRIPKMEKVQYLNLTKPLTDCIEFVLTRTEVTMDAPCCHLTTPLIREAISLYLTSVHFALSHPELCFLPDKDEQYRIDQAMILYYLNRFTDAYLAGELCSVQRAEFDKAFSKIFKIPEEYTTNTARMNYHNTLTNYLRDYTARTTNRCHKK